MTKIMPISGPSSFVPTLILEPLDDLASLWAKINAATIPGFTGPLLLPDGYALATFLTDLAALKAAYATDGTTTDWRLASRGDSALRPACPDGSDDGRDVHRRGHFVAASVRASRTESGSSQVAKR